jgi:predicted PhzF superfamily epimerase YddE/YHI9
MCRRVVAFVHSVRRTGGAAGDYTLLQHTPAAGMMLANHRTVAAAHVHLAADADDDDSDATVELGPRGA